MVRTLRPCGWQKLWPTTRNVCEEIRAKRRGIPRPRPVRDSWLSTRDMLTRGAEGERRGDVRLLASVFGKQGLAMFTSKRAERSTCRDGPELSSNGRDV